MGTWRSTDGYLEVDRWVAGGPPMGSWRSADGYLEIRDHQLGIRRWVAGGRSMGSWGSADLGRASALSRQERENLTQRRKDAKTQRRKESERRGTWILRLFGPLPSCFFASLRLCAFALNLLLPQGAADLLNGHASAGEPLGKGSSGRAPFPVLLFVSWNRSPLVQGEVQGRRDLRRGRLKRLSDQRSRWR